MRRLLVTVTVSVTVSLTLGAGVGSALAAPGTPDERHSVCVVFPSTPSDPDPDGYCVTFENPRLDDPRG